ncbi:GAP family protein [Leifsonia poae]|uniref:GAP family protein n=1 Tax=Leifsonia poae TaxID=110933 RepID=UPI003D67987A
MKDVAEVLPFALTVAFTTLPVLLTLVVLLGTERASRGWLIAGGYAFGLAAVFMLAAVGFVRLSVPRGPAVDWALVLAGAALIVIAGIRWERRRRRRRSSHVEKHNRLESRMQHLGARGALLLGLQFAFHPENLLLAVAASSRTIDADTWVQVVSALVFAVVGVSTVAIPTIAFTVAGRRVKPALERIRDAILRHSAAVTDGLILLVGLVLVIVGVWELLAG